VEYVRLHDFLAGEDLTLVGDNGFIGKSRGMLTITHPCPLGSRNPQRRLCS
jgi:hypothetical protein